MLLLSHIVYIHPNKDFLFDHIDLAVQRHDKIALIGNNGTGKSTLLKIIAGELQPSSGQFKSGAIPYYVPQVFVQFNELSVAQALRIDAKLKHSEMVLQINKNEPSKDFAQQYLAIASVFYEEAKATHAADLVSK